jgi:cyanophycinase-like exopeptidase
VGVTVATGTAVGAAVSPGIAVGGTEVGAAVVGMAVAVAEEPQAKITASNIAKGPRIIAFGFFNQWFKAD